MNYQLDIVIKKPISEVISLFDDPDNLQHWQPGFVSFKHLSGEEGSPGAQSEIIYKMGKSDFVLIETLIRRDLPSAFDANYQSKGVLNKVKNQFESVDQNTTRWSSQTEVELSSFFMKVFVFFRPKAFSKMSYSYMENFKQFAEKN